MDHFKHILMALENARAPNRTGRRMLPNGKSKTQKRKANRKQPSPKSGLYMSNHSHCRRGRGTACGLNRYWGGVMIPRADYGAFGSLKGGGGSQ